MVIVVYFIPIILIDLHDNSVRQAGRSCFPHFTDEDTEDIGSEGAGHHNTTTNQWLSVYEPTSFDSSGYIWFPAPFSSVVENLLKLWSVMN